MYIWVVLEENVGKYTIHWASGILLMLHCFFFNKKCSESEWCPSWWFQTHSKNMFVKIGSFPQIFGVKSTVIKNVWNRHLKNDVVFPCSFQPPVFLRVQLACICSASISPMQGLYGIPNSSHQDSHNFMPQKEKQPTLSTRIPNELWISLTNKKINALEKKQAGRVTKINHHLQSLFIFGCDIPPTFFFILLQGVCQPGFIHFLGFFINLPGLLVRRLFQASGIVWSFRLGHPEKNKRPGRITPKNQRLDTGFWWLRLEIWQFLVSMLNFGGGYRLNPLVKMGWCVLQQLVDFIKNFHGIPSMTQDTISMAISRWFQGSPNFETLPMSHTVGKILH